MPSNEELLAELAALRTTDLPTRGGRTLAHVYDSGLPCLDGLATAAYSAFAPVNGLDTAAFPSVVRLENEVVSFVARLLGGDAATRGSFTGGGTESILLAVRAAREHSRAVRGVTEPELVAPDTAHAAFRKAAHYLGLRLVTVPTDPSSCVPDPADMAAAITERTALVAVSAPSHAHGVLDPVAETANAAAERGVWCHVDACVGGMVLPFLRRLGHELPDFDLSVPGVRSLSVDLHKYGFAHGGASVVLYRDGELRRHQYFSSTDWPGHPVVHPTAQGTRSAGPLAAAWAVLRRLDEEGYTELAATAIGATEEIVAGINGIDGLRVVGAPAATLLCVASEHADPLHVADEMRERGWFLRTQLSFGAHRRNLHLTVTPATAPRVPELLSDLADSVRAAAALPSPDPAPDLAAAVAALDADTVSSEDLASVLDAAGLDRSAGGLPSRTAPLLALLDGAPTALRERLLTELTGSLLTGSGL
ncbi:aspartate aminotransferase family protein [Thermobifida halotolerans]|uniref:Aspartate aminotransferase family protein n=1 Tax=Thermobifida halotolerans TaxID=483545 RepID=A0A399FWB6_9ACTN|nr:aminotransferase class V-fold PLP-dependent enzyme [Thermobifida halotolerans]UOE18918.1 aspartate aminotransferase family protein [Thermobifida halotolerans]